MVVAGPLGAAVVVAVPGEAAVVLGAVVAVAAVAGSARSVTHRQVTEAGGYVRSANRAELGAGCVALRGRAACLCRAGQAARVGAAEAASSPARFCPIGDTQRAKAGQQSYLVVVGAGGDASDKPA